MNKQDMLKIQPCVLRVSIHCDGCKHKVQKQLQKIEGVYKVSIDVEQGKVTVSGNVDPATLIRKLEKSGKHAELWGGGGQKGPITIMNNQFKNIQMEKGNFGKDGKGQKGGKGQPMPGAFPAPKEMNFKNEFKDVKFSGKDKKSVKFNLPEDESDEFDEFDPDDDDDDGLDDHFDKGFSDHQPPSKAASAKVQGGKAIKATKDGHQKGKKGNDKKGSRIDSFLKGMLGKAGVKTGTPGNHSKKANKPKGGDKKGGGGGGFSPPLQGKSPGKGGKNGKAAAQTNQNWSKKPKENFDGYPKLDNRHPGFNEMSPNPGMMGQQMPNFRPMPGLPPGAAMNPGYMHPGHFPGAGQGMPHPQNPQQQQYMDQMRMMMMMNQQQQQQQQQQFHGGGYNHPAGGGYMMQQQQHPPMSYGPPHPPPGNDQYTHMFSDENTGSCSIM